MKALMTGSVKEWLPYFRELRRQRPGDHSFVRWCDSRNRQVLKHFDTDYSESRGVAELGSEVERLGVSVYVLDDLHSVPAHARISEVVDITCNVILKNGESLSRIEALEGLGDFSPRLIEERIRRIQNEWLPTDKRGARLAYHKSHPDGLQPGED